MIITDGIHTVKITVRMWNNGIGYGEDISNDIFEDVPANGVNEEESNRIGFDAYNVKDVSYCIDYAVGFMNSVNIAGSAESMNVFVEDLSKKEKGYLYIEQNSNDSYYNIYLIYDEQHDKTKARKAKEIICAYDIKDSCPKLDSKIAGYIVSCYIVPKQFARIFMNGYNDTALKLFKRLGFEVVFENPFGKNL